MAERCIGGLRLAGAKPSREMDKLWIRVSDIRALLE
jgi:hypothetical protein